MTCELGRKPARGIDHAAHRLFVGRDEHRAALGGAGEVAQDQRLRTAGERGEGQRAAGGEDAVEIGHAKD